MSNRTPEQHPLSEVLKVLQESTRPLSRWTGQSLEEIYQEGQSSLIRLKGPDNMNVKYYPRAFRIIALQENEFKGITLSLESPLAGSAEALARELRKEVNQLPNVEKIDRDTDRIVRRIFTSEGKQAVAVLELASEVTTNQRIIQVVYPNVLRSIVRNLFSSLGIPIPEIMEREAAAGIAIKYLKTIPFHASEPRILFPEELNPQN